MLRLVADPTAGAAAMRVLTGPRWRLGARDIAALWRRAVATRRQRGARRESAEQIAAQAGAGRRHRVPGRRDLRSRARPAVFGGGICAHRRARRRADRAARPPRPSAARPGRRGAPGARRRLRGPGGAAASRQAGRAPSNSTRSPTWSAGYADRATALRHRSTVCWPTWTRPRSSRTAWRRLRSSWRQNRVQVLTVHAAKGLEWQVVAVPHLSAGVFPSTASARTWLTDAADLPPLLRGDRPPSGVHGVPVLDTSDVTNRKQLSDKISAHRSATRATPRRRGAPAAVRGDHPRRGHPAAVRPPLGRHRDQAARPVGFPVRAQGHHREVGRCR